MSLIAIIVLSHIVACKSKEQDMRSPLPSAKEIATVEHLSGNVYFDKENLIDHWESFEEHSFTHRLGDDRVWQTGVINFYDGRKWNFRTDRISHIIIEGRTYKTGLPTKTSSAQDIEQLISQRSDSHYSFDFHGANRIFIKKTSFEKSPNTSEIIEISDTTLKEKLITLLKTLPEQGEISQSVLPHTRLELVGIKGGEVCAYLEVLNSKIKTKNTTFYSNEKSVAVEKQIIKVLNKILSS